MLSVLLSLCLAFTCSLSQCLALSLSGPFSILLSLALSLIVLLSLCLVLSLSCSLSVLCLPLLVRVQDGVEDAIQRARAISGKEKVFEDSKLPRASCLFLRKSARV